MTRYAKDNIKAVIFLVSALAAEVFAGWKLCSTLLADTTRCNLVLFWALALVAIPFFVQVVIAVIPGPRH